MSAAHIGDSSTGKGSRTEKGAAVGEVTLGTLSWIVGSNTTVWGIEVCGVDNMPLRGGEVDHICAAALSRGKQN